MSNELSSRLDHTQQKGDYEYAARKLGLALMHDLACSGDLNNEEVP